MTTAEQPENITNWENLPQHYIFHQKAVNAAYPNVHVTAPVTVTNHMSQEPSFPSPRFNNDGLLWEKFNSQYEMPCTSNTSLPGHGACSQAYQPCQPDYSSTFVHELEQPLYDVDECTCPGCCLHRTGGQFHLPSVRR